MPVHIPGMWRIASEWQKRPCIWRSISWPSCRLASYLLNETVATDLDNRTPAEAPHSLRCGLCCIAQSPCAIAKQHRQPWTLQWVDMQSLIIRSFGCCHYFSLNAADDFHSPGLFLSAGWWLHRIVSDTPEDLDAIHTLLHITWVDMWLWLP